MSSGLPAGVTGARPNWALRVGIAAMALLAVAVAVLELGSYGPRTYLIAFIASVVPMPLLVFLVLRHDPYEPEPPRMLAFAFAWGAIVAAFLAGVFNLVGFVAVGSLLEDPDAGAAVAGSVVAPIGEEALKAAVLYLIVWRRRGEFNGVTDGIVYAGMVGLGFALAENIGYYAEYRDTLGAVIVARGVFSPFAHPLFTAMTGIGLALALKGARLRLGPAVLGLAGAMALHSAWNTTALVAGAFVGAYVLFFVPVFIVVVRYARRAARKEGEFIRHHLQPEVLAGALSAGEVEALASVPARRELVRLAAVQQGDAGRDAARAFQHATSELARANHRQSQEPPTAESGAAAGRWRAEVTALRSRLPVVARPPAHRPPVPPTGRWAPDPYGRHQLRYWDGRLWTEHVADGGHQSIDPV